jgi:REP element-mobilizing transposase RayT
MELEAGIYHVYARGNERRAIFADDRDRRDYLMRLASTAKRHRWHLMAYCLMPNHVHLLVETVEPNLGRGMHWLQGGYAQRFNARHGRVGHLFQGRYGAVEVTTDAQLWVAASYIVVNPVAAGLCARPEEWRWSSHAAALGGDAPRWLDVPRLMEFFSVLGGEPAKRYADYVEAQAGERVA